MNDCSETGNELIDTVSDFIIAFEQASEAAGKLFIPDHLDEKIVANLLKYTQVRTDEVGFINDVIERYMDLSMGQVTTIKHFAERFPELFYAVKDNRDAKYRYHKLMQETKERMERN